MLSGSPCTLRGPGVSVSAGERGATDYLFQLRPVLDPHYCYRTAFFSFVVRSDVDDGGKGAGGDKSGTCKGPTVENSFHTEVSSHCSPFPSPVLSLRVATWHCVPRCSTPGRIHLEPFAQSRVHRVCLQYVLCFLLVHL